ncbi:hypothetical protein BGZ50_009611 [Haplosporangium sp. Z 11]|nr:hypothetical protein BGZ50_009611 [Haplosporangium sp. Z 11]
MRGADPKTNQDAAITSGINPRTDQALITTNVIDPEAGLDTLTETVRGSMTPQKYRKSLALHGAVEGMENMNRRELEVGRQNPASQPIQGPIQSKDDIELRSLPTPAAIGPETSTFGSLMEAKSLPSQTSAEQSTDHRNGRDVPISLTPHVLNAQARKNGMSLQPGSHRLHDPRKKREQQQARRDEEQSDSWSEQLKGSSKQEENNEAGSLSVRTDARVSGAIKNDDEESIVIFKGAAKEQLAIAEKEIYLDIVRVDNNTVPFEQAKNSSVPSTTLTLPATDASSSAFTSASTSTSIPNVVRNKRIKIRR